MTNGPVNCSNCAKEFDLADAHHSCGAGLTYTALSGVTPNGKFYTYYYNRQLSELFSEEAVARLWLPMSETFQKPT